MEIGQIYKMEYYNIFISKSQVPITALSAYADRKEIEEI
jgi:hypothetical protein